ncbi:MAG: hypothetical protein ACI86H_002074 [bacterium]|jgi:hypothetical protein
MANSFTGRFQKMGTQYNPETSEVSYHLNLDGEDVLSLNELLGQTIQIEFLNQIFCSNCNVQVKKTYGGAYCYPCFSQLANADLCFMQPHRCHHHLGTCRSNEFAEAYCFQPHILYLAKSSHIKIGITKQGKQIARWMDQGASEAKIIGVFPDRFQVGAAESAISKHLSDRTNWRKMLQGELIDANFEEPFQKILEILDPAQKEFLNYDEKSYQFIYPQIASQKKIVSKKLDKNPSFKQQLLGIKGQYLILDSHVFNVRSHTGYQIRFTTFE